MRYKMKEIENWLKSIKKQSIIVEQNGFIISKTKLERAHYSIDKDILTIQNMQCTQFMKVNLNQIYFITVAQNELTLNVDNDMIIKIKLT